MFDPFVTTKLDGPACASGLDLSVGKALTEVQLGTGPEGTVSALTLTLDKDGRV